MHAPPPRAKHSSSGTDTSPRNYPGSCCQRGPKRTRRGRRAAALPYEIRLVEAAPLFDELAVGRYGERVSRQARTLGIWEAVIAPPPAVAKRIRRARDWIDSTGMSRSCRGDRRAASDENPVGIRRVLQRHPDPHIVGQGCARATERAAAAPGQGSGGVTRGWAPSRIRPESAVSRSSISRRHTGREGMLWGRPTDRPRTGTTFAAGRPPSKNGLYRRAVAPSGRLPRERLPIDSPGRSRREPPGLGRASGRMMLE
jgi:hypothetical protein